LSSGPLDLSLAIEPPPEIAEALRSSGADRGAFGAPLFYFASVGSTNDLAARLAEAGATEGTTVATEAQTAGRGRLGRAWCSPDGAGLYVSVVIRPDACPKMGSDTVSPDGRRSEIVSDPMFGAGSLPTMITLAAGVALADAVREATGLHTEIKWPNDLMCGRRKLAGILAEGSSQGTGLDFVVLGFGLNIRSAAYPADVAVRATSVEAELGRPVDRGLVFARALANLASAREALRRGDVVNLLDRWRGLAPSAVGSAVTWPSPAGPRLAVTAGLDVDGALLVEIGGAFERVVSGEIIWR
jgi:BirA family biotin operon repressor/biotin-[acetyl-CoA-carboxylase] ligase